MLRIGGEPAFVFVVAQATLYRLCAPFPRHTGNPLQFVAGLGAIFQALPLSKQVDQVFQPSTSFLRLQ